MRKQLNIPLGKKIVLFGANDVTNKRKGFSLLLDALNKLIPEGAENIMLGIFGDFPKGFSINSKFNILNFGTINSENSLALIYSLSDLFVLPSTEDNLPNTVLESLACGTPVVAFNIGGMPDMIAHLQTGYLAKPGDIDDLANGIKLILSGNNLEYISKECRIFAEKNYDLKIQAESYLDKYTRILNENKDNKYFEITKHDSQEERIMDLTYSKQIHFDNFKRFKRLSASG